MTLNWQYMWCMYHAWSTLTACLHFHVWTHLCEHVNMSLCELITTNWKVHILSFIYVYMWSLYHAWSTLTPCLHFHVLTHLCEHVNTPLCELITTNRKVHILTLIYVHMYYIYLLTLTTCIHYTCVNTLVWTCEQLPMLTLLSHVAMFKVEFFFFVRISMRFSLVHCQKSQMNMYSIKSLPFITPILNQKCSQFSVYIHTVVCLLSGPSLHAE